MRGKLVINSIDNSKSVVFLYFIEGGWTRYKQTPRANFVNFVNKHSKKLETLTCSARADRLAHRRGPFGGSIWCSTYVPCLLVEPSKPKATNSM
jgi:hypothetical protein